VVSADSPLVIFHHKSQRNVDPGLGFIPLFRVVREIAEEMWPNKTYEWQSVAVECLQEAAEIYLVCLFDCGYCS
jgi:histone H3/H4